MVLRPQQDIIKNVYWSSHKAALTLVTF